MIPPYLKASVQTSKKTKKKKAGGQKGHPGSSRPKPENIDHHKEHQLESCPDCGGALQRCNGENSSRTRIIEDIPAEIRPEVTEHTIHRDYCPTCKKLVEPKVDAALPKSTIGHRTLTLSAYWPKHLTPISCQPPLGKIHGLVGQTDLGQKTSWLACLQAVSSESP